MPGDDRRALARHRNRDRSRPRRRGDLAARPGRRRPRLVRGRAGDCACRAICAVRFLFPHAPVIPVTINNGMRDARVVRHPRGRPQQPRRPRRRAPLAGAGRGADRARRGARRAGARGSCSPASRRAARSRCTPACDTPERLAGIVALSTYLIAPDALRGRGGRREPRCPDLHGARHAGSGRAFRWAETSREALVAARLSGRMAHVSDGALGRARGDRRDRAVPGARAVAGSGGVARGLTAARLRSSPALRRRRRAAASPRAAAGERSRNRNSICALTLRSSRCASRSSSPTAPDRSAAGTTCARPSVSRCRACRC